MIKITLTETHFDTDKEAEYIIKDDDLYSDACIEEMKYLIKGILKAKQYSEKTIDGLFCDGCADGGGDPEVKDRYRLISGLRNYNIAIESGMFYEFYPELTGEWETDKKTIRGENE
jgi:hypothetical protein